MVPTPNNHPHRNGEACRKVVPAHHHPRRIVLANRPEVAFRRRNINPELVYNGGPLIENVHVVTVYGGSTWQDPLSTPYLKKLNAFFSSIVTSQLIDQLSEYNTNGYTTGQGTDTNNDSYIITDSDPAPTVTDTDIQTMVHTATYTARTTTNRVNFLEQVDGWLPAEVERVYALLDNVPAHRAWDVLLFNLAHPRWEFVFQPTSAAYLNLIEPWWKTLRSLAFKGRHFETWEQMEEAVGSATRYWNAHRHPFVQGRRRRHRPRRKPGIAVLPKVS